jgi:arsenite-transporting ATPase
LNNLKRFYIFTGKGGVGKTTLSFSFVKYIQDNPEYRSKNIKYVYFKSNSLVEKEVAVDPLLTEAEKLGIQTLGLDLRASSEAYIGKKLKSQTLGKWIIKTPFFKALISMVPGFNYLIYLGQILELLSENQDLILVLDSPSSGHALTMLESTHNFRDIFESGIVFDDTKKMIDLLFKKGFMKVNVLTLPTLMSVNESQELSESLQKIDKIETSIICNNSFNTINGINEIELPDFLKTKIDNEQQVAEAYPDLITDFIPHSTSTNSQELIKDLVPSMKNLV